MPTIDIPKGPFTAVTATRPDIAQEVADTGVVEISSALLPSEAPSINQPGLNGQDFEI